MFRIVDKLLLFIYSIVIGAASIMIACIGFNWISKRALLTALDRMFEQPSIQISIMIAGIVLFLLSLRFFIVSLHRGSAAPPSIDQRTDFGDIRISIETIENLALKAASKRRGVKDLRARIRTSDSGLDIVLRVFVDGESSIPTLTEEIQLAVKSHIEDITGIPVSNVTVFVANVIQTGMYKSRVE
ncbi:alkaline shock response membrane anchor protein AmaP [Paenibacillus sp. Leaf72]|uniref:alkaline shock response membrane anchor protein AmaP n=1 Tax=Paenibacillus sp. Leaf72 TaxID=1736234 RepID=UPI0006FB3016|nr:alkaline shock response membrane anchor protein AmaP [Paenibacillus sp. Leaf72]KQO17500.1 hypothetical protein ASF12_02085 [Paenibacillus sp. Leaf72]